jgi:alanyl-tRNA synthetase
LSSRAGTYTHDPVTERLYDQDPGLFAFEARVLDSRPCGDGYAIVLDRTGFFPGGGGQAADRGTIGGREVLEVTEADGEVLHKLREPLAGGPVSCAVEQPRRRDGMEQHTGQHIFSQALVRAGGFETVSVHFGEDTTTVEVSAASIPEDKLREAEELANAVIAENRRVVTHLADSAEVSRFPLRRTPPAEERLRIVEVDGFDWAACCGVHVPSTGAIRMIKVVGEEKIRGRARVSLRMGRRAFEDYGRKVALVRGLSRLLTSGEDGMLRRVEELQNADREKGRELRRLRVEKAASLAGEAAAAAPRIGGALYVERLFESLGPEPLKAFAEGVVAAPGRIVAAVDRGPGAAQWIIAHSLDAAAGPVPDLSRLVLPLLPLIEGKGGGKGARMQGAGGKPEGARAFLDGFRSALEAAAAGG